MDVMSTAQILGNFGEFVGAVAVVATLGYVAVQLRQNTQMLRVSAIQGAERGISELMSNWTSSVETAALVQTGFSSYRSLSEDEKAFVGLICRRLLIHMDSMYWAYKQGVLPKEMWEREAKVLAAWANAEVGMAALQVGGFSEPFETFVNAEILRR